MELNPVAPAQSILYRFLTEGFGLPDADRLGYLGAMIGTVQAACEEMADSGEAGGPPPDLTGLEAALAEARSLNTGDLQAEYTRLFVNGMPSTPCRLVESVQREGVLVGTAAEDVTEMYLRFGLEVKGREPDHLTAELEFLTYLTGTPVAAGKEAERYRRERIRFVQDHLLQWAPGLAEKIRLSSATSLYASLADLLDWLLAGEVALKV